MEYKRVTAKPVSQLSEKSSEEASYWKKFKELGLIPSVSFMPVEPYDVVVCSSTRAQVYCSKTNTVKKTVSRTRELIQSASFRQDGKLLISGDESGLIQIHDMASRTMLRSLRVHKGPVRSVRFSLDKVQTLSASDDKTVNMCDIASEKTVVCFEDHQDYVRSALYSDHHPDMVISGSYDHHVRLWDVRSPSLPMMTMNHESPVETILIISGGSLAISAGSNYIKIWDILSGGKCLETISHHQKTITSLFFDSDRNILISGSLDHHLKFVSMEDYQVEHTMTYPSPILSFDISKNRSHLIVGMASGLLSIKKNNENATTPSSVRPKKENFIKPNTYKYFIRGAKETDFSDLNDNSLDPSSSQAEVIVVKEKKLKKLKDHDIYLKKFQYGRALDAVLNKQDPPVTVALLEELLRRNGLASALSNRDEVGLRCVSTFIMKFITHPQYSPILILACEKILDIYGHLIGESPLLDEIFLKLRCRLTEELKFQSQVTGLVGMMDMLISASRLRV